MASVAELLDAILEKLDMLDIIEAEVNKLATSMVATGKALARWEKVRFVAPIAAMPPTLALGLTPPVASSPLLLEDIIPTCEASSANRGGVACCYGGSGGAAITLGTNTSTGHTITALAVCSCVSSAFAKEEGRRCTAAIFSAWRQPKACLLEVRCATGDEWEFATSLYLSYVRGISVRKGEQYCPAFAALNGGVFTNIRQNRGSCAVTVDR